MTRASHCLSAYFSGVGSVRETTLTAKSSDIPFAFTLASEDGDALFTGVESASAWIGGVSTRRAGSRCIVSRSRILGDPGKLEGKSERIEICEKAWIDDCCPLSASFDISFVKIGIYEPIDLCLGL